MGAGRGRAGTVPSNQLRDRAQASVPHFAPAQGRNRSPSLRRRDAAEVIVLTRSLCEGQKARVRTGTVPGSLRLGHLEFPRFKVDAQVHSSHIRTCQARQGSACGGGPGWALPPSPPGPSAARAAAEITRSAGAG